VKLANKANALGQSKAPLRSVFPAGDLQHYNVRQPNEKNNSGLLSYRQLLVAAVNFSS
jgi:hypothetical protein